MSPFCSRFRLMCLVAGFVGLLSTQTVCAEEPFADHFELHGYAHQAFLLNNSTANKHMGADSHGSFDLNALALLLSYRATDDLTIWTQLFANNESGVRLDWAFADYRHNDWLRVRGGQIKAPTGLLNETRDIKYLHNSTMEPGVYHEAADMLFESFRGASLLLTHAVAGGEVKLDLFGGAPVYFEGEESEERHYGMYGGRLTYDTPLEGLSLSASYSSIREQEREVNGDFASGSKSLVGGSLEFQRGGLHLMSECFQLTGMEHKKLGYYAEAAYTFFDQLTPFVRYDYYTSNKDLKGDLDKHQKDLTFGVGYRFNKHVAFKVEDHIISGFALPAAEYEEEHPLDPPLSGDKHWNLFAASLNLMF